jgi:AbrB family looped-hinge helix DNA binding protein
MGAAADRVALLRHRASAAAAVVPGLVDLAGSTAAVAAAARSAEANNQALCKEVHMAESTITSKGQTTIPAEIRALVHAKPGTRLLWSVVPDGTIIVRAKTKSILDMAGMLKATRGKRVRVEEMNPWR